ncbi:MAG: DUF1844 domain-containing protein [Candidatus Adiutricales bacterium]
MSDDEKNGFVIKDRRLFATEHEAKEEVEPEAEAAPEARETSRPEPEPETPPPDDTTQAPPLPVINFSTFVFSLSSSVLLHLGEMPDPATNKKVLNLSLAKQSIDILVMLQEKTSGNLDEEEENLLKNLLYELRMKYVAHSK